MIHRNRIGSCLATAFIMLLPYVLCTPLHAETEITVLLSGDSAPYQAVLEGFQEYMRDNGAEANYLVINTGEKNSSTAQLSQKMKKQDATLIYCVGTQACLSAQQLAHQRPVVATLVLSPDIIAPEAHATGVFLNYLPKTQLQWLKKLFPQFQRVGVIYNPEQNKELIDKASHTARQLGLELVTSPIDSPKELPAALKNLLNKIDILWALPDKMVLAPQTAKEVLLTSFRNRIPVIGASTPWVQGGALYALDWDYKDMGAQNAEMALKIIKGTSISSLPMAEPRSVSYSLNLKTAEHMKLDIPGSLAQGAKHVYQ